MVDLPASNLTNMFLKGSIGNQLVIYHLDTGTTRTVFSESVWLRSGGKKSELRVSDLKITSVTTHSIDLIGETDVCLTIGTQKLVIPVQIARNVSNNCSLGLDAISKVKGGKKLLDSLVGLFSDQSVEDDSMELSDSSPESYQEGQTELKQAVWPEAIEVDSSLTASLLSEDVWKKSGNHQCHLKPVKSTCFHYKDQHLDVAGEASIHLRIKDFDFIVRVLICRGLGADGVLNAEFKSEYENIALKEEDKEQDKKEYQQE